MEIVVNNIHEAEMLRKMIHKINDHGIDKIFDVIKESIQKEETNNFYIINPSTMEIDKEEIEDYKEKTSLDYFWMESLR